MHSVFASAFTANEEAAAANRRVLREAGVFAIDVIGGAGSGKTTLIESTRRQLGPDVACAAIVSNLHPRRDADRLAYGFDRVIQVAAPSLGAQQVAAALKELCLADLDVLFIENATTTAYPTDFDLGQNVRAAVFSVCGGDDKPSQQPYLVRESDVVVLTKLDLLPYVPFEPADFRRDVRRLNPQAKLIELSGLKEEGMEGWIQWLQRRRTGAPTPRGTRRRSEWERASEVFFG